MPATKGEKAVVRPGQKTGEGPPFPPSRRQHRAVLSRTLVPDCLGLKSSLLLASDRGQVIYILCALILPSVKWGVPTSCGCYDD